MSKIVWFQLNKLPDVNLLDTFCRGVKKEIFGSDEVVFFMTGTTTPDDISRLVDKLKLETVTKNSFFISLGREHIDDDEDDVKKEIECIFDAYCKGQYGINETFAEQIRMSHNKKYFEQWNSFFQQDDLCHKGTIHYYRCKDSVFALHINTTISSKGIGYYIIDVDSLYRLMNSEESKTSKLKIAFGRNVIDYIYPTEEQRQFVESFINDPDWLFYLCNSENPGIRRYPEDKSSRKFFYTIALPNSNTETQYIVGHYDTEKNIGKVELFMYNYNLRIWIRNANFATEYNNAKRGTLYYPAFNIETIKASIFDEILGIVNEFKNCIPNESPNIRYLQLQNHDPSDLYVKRLLEIIESAVNSFNPGSWEVIRVPDTNNKDDFNRYPTKIRDSTERLFILCCSYHEEYNENIFIRQIEYLQQRKPSLCIFVLILYYDNTDRILSSEHETVQFHFDLELVIQIALNILENIPYKNPFKNNDYIKNLLMIMNRSAQDFHQIPENEQNISTTQEQKNNEQEQKSNEGDFFDR